ncbi:MAG: alpha-amylase family glycosyl hydrolase [bacterium]|nr:alpha-amylase family glycosyl hydrolase [bacterium]
MARLVIREVNLLAAVRQFDPDGRINSLDAIPDTELDRWCTLPLTHIWGMGLWRRSPAGRLIAIAHEGLRRDYFNALPDWKEDDVAGSPYSIQSYEPCECLGSLTSLLRFRHRLAERGLGFILDFVPNHLAIDHPWVKQYPGYFISRGEIEPGQTPPPGWFEVHTTQGVKWLANGRDPYFPAWTDTAQLDFRQIDTREAMIRELLKIAELCDGVRCDMAMLVLNPIFKQTWGGNFDYVPEFWSQAIDAVRAIKPSFLFLAEAYWGTENRLIELGFDAVYDKDFMDRAVYGNTNELRSTLPERRAWGVRRLRFLENHDEARIASRVPPEQLPVLSALLWMQPGYILWHEGQEYGAKVKLPVQLTRRPVEPVLLEQAAFCTDCGRWLREFPFEYAFSQIIGVNPSGQNDDTYKKMVPILWWAGNRRLLWIGNLSSVVASGRVPLHISGIAGRTVRLRDIRDNTEYERDGDEMLGIGLFIQLPPDGMHWFEMTTVFE